jgi:transcription-repair coupling factor (superfamily II helicase)
MDTIGYDLYMRLLSEAILEEKGERARPKTECTVDLNIDAYIPEEYIGGGAARIDAYKKIALIESDADRRDVCDELLDRYGNLPATVVNLLNIALIRAAAAGVGITRVERRAEERAVRFVPERLNFAAISRLAAEQKGAILLNAGSSPYFTLRLQRGGDIMTESLRLLQKYAEYTQTDVKEDTQ